VDRGLAALESDRGAWTALVVAMVASIVVSLWFTRGTTFWFDEFTLYSGSRGFSITGLVTQHNAQLILLPRLIYATVFKVFGADYLVIRTVEAVGVALVGATVYALARPRIGALALAPAVVLMFFGYAWDSTLTGNGIINVYCLLPGLAALLVLDRGGRFALPLACLLLALSLSSWTAGLAFVAGAAVLLLQRGRLRGSWWVPAVPLLLWGAWWVFKPGFHGPLYGGATGFKASNVLLIPNFAADSLAAAGAAVSGLSFAFSQTSIATNGVTADTSWGPVIATLAVAGIALALRRSPPSRWPWPWFAALVTFWSATAMVTFALRPPSAGRYVYVAAALALVLASWALDGYRLKRRTAALVAVALVFVVATSLAQFRDASGYLRAYSTSLRADLAAIEIARGHESPTYIPSAGAANNLFLGTTAQPVNYLPAVDRNGSFADTIPELRSAPEGTREEVDQILATALGLHLAPAGPPPVPSSCGRVDDAGFRLRPGTTLLKFAGPRTTQIKLRRFASAFTAPLGGAAPGRYYALRIPTDLAPEPWYAQASPARPVIACRP
jgi:hypothetical protein